MAEEAHGKLAQRGQGLKEAVDGALKSARFGGDGSESACCILEGMKFAPYV